MSLFSSQVTPPADVRLLLCYAREVCSNEGIAGCQLEEYCGFAFGDLLECFPYTPLLLRSVRLAFSQFHLNLFLCDPRLRFSGEAVYVGQGCPFHSLASMFCAPVCNGRARNGNGIQGTRGGCGRELGSGNGCGWGGGAVEGQGMVEDATLRDSDGGATRAGLSAMRMEMRRLG
jgi:hypothetical protein